MFRGLEIMVRGPCAPKPSALAACTPSSAPSSTTTSTRSEWPPSRTPRWARCRAPSSRWVRWAGGAKELDGKHGIKQVDRLFSNTGVDVWKLFGSWVPFVIGERPEIVVAFDWTDFDWDNQSERAESLGLAQIRRSPTRLLLRHSGRANALPPV